MKTIACRFCCEEYTAAEWATTGSCAEICEQEYPCLRDGTRHHIDQEVLYPRRLMTTLTPYTRWHVICPACAKEEARQREAERLIAEEYEFCFATNRLPFGRPW